VGIGIWDVVETGAQDPIKYAIFATTP